MNLYKKLRYCSRSPEEQIKLGLSSISRICNRQSATHDSLSFPSLMLHASFYSHYFFFFLLFQMIPAPNPEVQPLNCFPQKSNHTQNFTNVVTFQRSEQSYCSLQSLCHCADSTASLFCSRLFKAHAPAVIICIDYVHP